MDRACEDGMPGSDLKLETGRSWFNNLFNIIPIAIFITEPQAAHSAAASCLTRRNMPKSTAVSHLLCIKRISTEIIILQEFHLKMLKQEQKPFYKWQHTSHYQI